MGEGEGEYKWLTLVNTYLKPAFAAGAINIWNDERLLGGDDWEREINGKLRRCDIFMLLVSENSTASEFIFKREIPIIRKRQANGEDVHFYPVLLKPTPEIGLKGLLDKNFRPRNRVPLSKYSGHDLQRHLADIANEIVGIAEEIAEKRYGVCGDKSDALGPATTAESNPARSGKRGIRIALGTGSPFENTESSDAVRRQHVRVRLVNDSKTQIANCELGIVSLDPPNKGVSNCMLKSDISIGAISDFFVDVAYFEDWPQRGAHSDHMRLVVPMVGGFFAEAFDYAKLPLVPHTFKLRLKRFSDVYDDVLCRLLVSDRGFLKLERIDGLAMPRSSSASTQETLDTEDKHKFLFDELRGVAISKSTGIKFSREFIDDALGRNEGLDDEVQRHHDDFVRFAQLQGYQAEGLVRTERSDQFRSWYRTNSHQSQ